MQMQALILEDNGARARRRDVPFERMKVVQLKEELAARGSTRTGLKMVLQRRLHAMLMQSAIEHQAREVEDELVSYYIHVPVYRQIDTVYRQIDTRQTGAHLRLQI